jgi:hypothetical protein
LIKAFSKREKAKGALRAKPLIAEAPEFVAMLTASVKTARSNASVGGAE